MSSNYIRSDVMLRHIVDDIYEDVEVCRFSKAGVWAWLNTRHRNKYEPQNVSALYNPYMGTVVVRISGRNQPEHTFIGPVECWSDPL